MLAIHIITVLQLSLTIPSQSSPSIYKANLPSFPLHFQPNLYSPPQLFIYIPMQIPEMSFPLLSVHLRLFIHQDFTQILRPS